MGVAFPPDASWFQRILAALYDGLHDRCVTGYAYDASDRWTPARVPTQWTAHLECWFDLGGAITLAPGGYQHDSRMIFGSRFAVDDDALSQSRLHAAIRDACEYLLTQPLPLDARVLGISSALIEGVFEGGWVNVTIGFSLFIPR